MAYFDSPKNRAMWERRLAGLRKEKEHRRETGYVPEERGGKAADKEQNPFRRRITLAELEKRELAKDKTVRTRWPGRELRAQRQALQPRTPEKQGPRL